MPMSTARLVIFKFAILYPVIFPLVLVRFGITPFYDKKVAPGAPADMSGALHLCKVLILATSNRRPLPLPRQGVERETLQICIAAVKTFLSAVPIFRSQSMNAEIFS